METVDLITQLVGNLGFPIFVAIFMLLKNSKETKALTDAINMLSTKIDMLMAGAKVEHE